MPSAPTSAPDDEKLWAKILCEVQSRSASSLPQGSLLVLGDNECGKTSLIARLQHNDDPKKGAGLEYHYIEVNPDYRDGTYAYQLSSALPDVGPGESTRLGIWVLDGDPSYARLIRFALGSCPDTLNRSLVMLCASMAEPWSLLDSLRVWTKMLDEQVSQSGVYDERTVRDAQDRQARFWQEYVEPLDSSSHSDMGAKVPSMEVDQVLLPLSETTLVNNIGLPLIVVITKCDAMSSLEKDYDFKEEHFDFIQSHIRKFCLHYGAALVYTSVKEGRNMDTLYKYLLHRIYGFPFTMPAHVVDKDAVFIPAGWDNEKKIRILHENLTTFKSTDAYSDHVRKPILRRPAAAKDGEVQAEDEQSFLAKQLAIIASAAPPSSTAAATSVSPTPKRAQPLNMEPSPLSSRSSAAAVGGANSNNIPVLANSQSPIGNKLDAKATVPPVDGGVSLAAFFHNLLKAKTTDEQTSPAPTTTTTTATTITNAQQQPDLDQRMFVDEQTNGEPNGNDDSASEQVST